MRLREILEAQKPTRASLQARRREEYMRIKGIHLGQNFSRLSYFGEHGDRIFQLFWIIPSSILAGEIVIILFLDLNQALIGLDPDNNYDDDPSEADRIWGNRTPSERSKLVDKICGPIGIASDSIDTTSEWNVGNSDSNWFWNCRLIPNSPLDVLMKMGSFEQASEELALILGKDPSL